MSTACKVCLSDDQEAIEAEGLKALGGELSWRSAARDAGLGTNYTSLKNHMERHYTTAVERAQEAVVQTASDDIVAKLREAQRVAPSEIAPLYDVVIHNFEGLRSTKPSQQHLIMALRTIQEMTGMKQEQRILLGFAERMFGSVEAPKEIENVIDVEVVAPLPTDLDATAYASLPAPGGGES